MARRPFFGQSDTKIAKMDMQAATAPGRAYAQGLSKLGESIGEGIKVFTENKRKGEAAEMQIGAILEGMTDERKEELASGDSKLSKSLQQFMEGELPNSKKEALLGSLATLDARDRLDRQEELSNTIKQFQLSNIASQQANRAELRDQRNLQQEGAKQFDSLMFDKGFADEKIPSEFMEKVAMAREDGLLNDYGTSLATNHFINLQNAENQALAGEQKYRNQVQFELFKDALKNPPQEEPYQAGADIMEDNISRSMEIINTNPKFTTGLGSYLKSIPGTDAKTLDNLFKTIKSNIGFDYLQAMRKNSPTGGALGNVSNQELEGLQSVFGSLEQSQSDKELKYNLQLLNHVYNNVIHGVGKHNVLHPDKSNPSNQGSQSMQSLLDEEARLKELLYQRQGIFNAPESQIIDAK
jgi:hypothetical protein